VALFCLRIVNYPEVRVNLARSTNNTIAKSGVCRERLMRVVETALVNKNLHVLRGCQRRGACLTIGAHT
jgi:hypothetical protein